MVAINYKLSFEPAAGACEVVKALALKQILHMWILYLKLVSLSTMILWSVSGLSFYRKKIWYLPLLSKMSAANLVSSYIKHGEPPLFKGSVCLDGLGLSVGVFSLSGCDFYFFQ